MNYSFFTTDIIIIMLDISMSHLISECGFGMEANLIMLLIILIIFFLIKKNEREVGKNESLKINKTEELELAKIDLTLKLIEKIDRIESERKLDRRRIRKMRRQIYHIKNF